MRKTLATLKDWERQLKRRHGRDISTPAARLNAHLHAHLADYRFLRVVWTNQHEIAPGIWRSNQPGPGRFARLERLGVRAILNLRGFTGYSSLLFEAEECAKRGIQLESLDLSARQLAPAADYLALLDLFATLPRPLLMHCKSGADRAGLAAAFYLIDREGSAPDDARRQLSWRFGHVARGPTGILDHLLTAYSAQPKPLRQWLVEDYDPEALTARYLARQRPSSER